MKPIRNGINNPNGYNSFTKSKYNLGSSNTSDLPSIPIVDSGASLEPKFNLRIHITPDTELTREKVNLDLIKGTVKSTDNIDKNFNPKNFFVNKKMRKVWKWILLNPKNQENVIFPTNIILAKVTDDEYYVVGGLRRVVALKKSNIKVINAFIIDYRDVYNKILEYRNTVEAKKQQRKSLNSISTTSTKFIRPGLKPTPILKADKIKRL